MSDKLPDDLWACGMCVECRSLDGLRPLFVFGAFLLRAGSNEEAMARCKEIADDYCRTALRERGVKEGFRVISHVTFVNNNPGELAVGSVGDRRSLSLIAEQLLASVDEDGEEEER